MKFGLTLPAFGDFADPLFLAEAAQSAEIAGWDGFFIWDHVNFDSAPHPMAAPSIALAAVALATKRILLGTMITSLARRRPWVVAREMVTLDYLSQGRVIFGAGLGGSPQGDFGVFGEEADDRIRAEKLDEGLDILAGLWSAKPFHHQGKHYQIQSVEFHPAPLQIPRIPIWIGGSWNKTAPMRRAAKWDGYFPLKWGEVLAPEEWLKLMEKVNSYRAESSEPYTWIHQGLTQGNDPEQAVKITKKYADIGVSWWIENIDPWNYGWKWEDAWSDDMTWRMSKRIQQGPPRF